MNQLTMADIEYSNRKKKTKREEFLDTMEEIIPWAQWVELIRPYYFNNVRGRKPIGIETMLRMYLMQIWFSLSDEDIEDSIYDSYAMRSFMHIDFSEQQVPDATTLLEFRHMLEKHNIGEKIFTDVNRCFDEAGLIMHSGTIVDARDKKEQQNRIRHKYLHPGQPSTSLTGDHPAGIRKLLLSVGYSYHEKHIIEKSIEEQTA